LLDSVIDSIQSPTKVSPGPVLAPKQDTAPPGSPRTRTTSEISSPTRRNRNLADALFGPEDQGVPQPPAQLPTVAPLNMSPSLSAERPVHDNLSTPHLPRSPLPSATSGRLPMGLMSSPNLTTTDQNELTLEVQRKADAATIALRSNPSNSKMPDTGTVPRKKINRDQISSPKLVSASTSVDTIPLPSASPILNSSSSSKFGQRIKKLRGTLRSKANATPTGEEVTPFPLDVKSSTTQSTSSHQSASRAHTISAHGGTASATDLGRFKVQVPTPPATSGPGLKGFIARFRKNKNPDGMLDTLPRPGDVPYSSASSTSFSPSPPRGPSPQPQFPQSAPPASKTSFRGTRRSPSTRSADHTQQRSQPLSRSMSVPRTTVESPEDDESPHNSTQKDDAALRQLFDAASNLGLDQAALTSLVARSTSTSSRSTGWRTHTSLAPSQKSRPSDILEDNRESVGATSVSDGRPSLEGFSARIAGPVIRKLSIKKHTDPSRRAQKEREDVALENLASSPPSQQEQPRQPTIREEKTPTSSRNTIIRRTIIMPSETKGIPIDINALLRKNSQSTTRKRRSGSGASVHSNRSIQDRAPTPPPPKSPGSSGRRFSTDTTSPPVPHLPHSFSSNLEVPPNTEKLSSTYDSLYVHFVCT
jgi:serine/arginine repetitive matrix protein 2